MAKIEVITAESCNCKQDEAFPDGQKPEYFTNRSEAVRAYIISKQSKTYFGVHLDCKHILNVVTK